jgi:hypothetical protein
MGLPIPNGPILLFHGQYLVQAKGGVKPPFVISATPELLAASNLQP